MQIKVPDYFTKFRCTADKCKDSCCVGWEIAIDEESKVRYSSLHNEIGREISKKTQHGYFPLDEDGRCVFLDCNGLCRIISTLGEGYLCDICREHPRYYGVGNDGIEGGLGLGCEEAARLILSSGGTADFTYTDHNVKYFSEDNHARITDDIRDIIYKNIKTLNAEKLIAFMLALVPIADGIAFDTCTGLEVQDLPMTNEENPDFEKLVTGLSDFHTILVDCESLGGEWTDAIDAMKHADLKELLSEKTALKSLIFYFTHRYVRECIEDITLGQRILFSLYSSLSIIAIAKAMDHEEALVRAAVLFSKNIEYSTKNIDLILDGLSAFL